MNNKNLIKSIIKSEIKKIIVENQNQDIWYHTTKKEYLDGILKYGLKINQKANFSQGSLSWIKKAYGDTPIFISKESGKYKDKDGVVLKIDISGLELLPDLPSLVDEGAEVTDNDSLFFDEDSTPDFMNNYDGEATFDDFLTDNNLIEGSKELTGTAAVLVDIHPSKISVLK